ncbi:MAG: enoyl-CoA hydratase/isomerase family protein [Alphaproteobacteria bacterium]|nr:enoyl-CoA hydratase/isomerase family protein [Alphaproteobacteria bacterium]
MIAEGSFDYFDLTLEEPGILVIRFNKPERLNGMRTGMKRDLVETVTQAQLDNRVRVVVFTGSGRAFCAGDDVTRDEQGNGNYRKAEASFMPTVNAGHDSPVGVIAGLHWISQAVNTSVRKLDKLSIAAINGVTIQTGLSLALACDFRFCAQSARLGSATLRFGAQPDEGGHFLLVQTIGLPKTVDFLFRKRIVTADEALELGLVHEVHEDAVLMDKAMDLARELAEGPQLAMRVLKRATYFAAEATLAQAFEDIAVRTGISDGTPDVREGFAAFKEKRKPHYNKWIEDLLAGRGERH